MIVVEELGFRYVGRRRPTLRGVTFRVERGETLLVLGPSGCGKSTLALCLNGLIPHAIEGDLTGRVVVDGLDARSAPVAAMAQRVGIVFQDPEAQFCTLTVEEEVAFGLENLAVPPAEMDARIDTALGAVGLAERRRERIERLSGGQKQRLALAAVLALRPAVLVLDEPTAQLDPAGAAEVVETIGRLRASGEHTLVVVEHRLDGLMHLVDRVLVLDAEGSVVAHGPPREVIAAHGAWLAEAGVWVPHVSELAHDLAEAGVRLEPFPLTVVEAVAALGPRLATTTQSWGAGSDGASSGQAVVAAGGREQRGEPLLATRDLTFRYCPDVPPVLRDVDLALWPGEIVAIVGANGAGKSTLGRLLVGLLSPTAGTIAIDGRDARALRSVEVARTVGYVFQYPEHQFIGVTALEDVAYGPRRAGVPEDEARARAQAMLDAFGLGALARAHPFSLSHGEQRRLSVAAMLVLGQRALVLDEPTFGQDRRNAYRLLDHLEALAAAGTCIVAITHDMRLVAERAQRVIVLADGAVLFDGAPDRLFQQPDVVATARLALPPLWQASQQLGLSQPLRGAADALTRLGAAVAATESGA